MAKEATHGLALADHNYAGENQIWKDYVKHEMRTARNWDKTWHFMKTDYRELVKDDYPDVGRKETPLPKHLQIAPAPRLEDCVHVYPSTRPVPRTTAGEVGWRSTDKLLQLEKYGQYGRRKGNIVKNLNWPNEAIG